MKDPTPDPAPTRAGAAVVAAVVATSLAVVVLAGCGPAHPGGAGSAPPCYQAIPVARAALHDSDADLAGVHRVALDEVRSQLTTLGGSDLPTEDDTAVCAIAFTGTFTRGQVDLASPQEHGRYAVIVVDLTTHRVVASAVLQRLPRSLGRHTL